MTPELGIALVVTLFWGPTALWLVFRTFRGHRGRLPGPFTAVTEPMRSAELAPDELEVLVGSHGFWVCGTCRSLNRREANRCYGCRTAKGSAGRQGPSELPVSRGVPVMAEGSAGRQGPSELPVSRGVPVMAEESTGRQRPSELPVSRGVPVMAEGIARSSGEAAGTTVALATPRNAPPAPEILVRAPEHVVSAAPPEAPAGVRVCPFVRSRNDPWTWYDYPCSGNFCFATSGRGVTSVASPRRFLTGLAGTKRPQPIDAEHQKSRCLTATHEQCARYPAVEVGVANR